jgi:hypothetical protein
MNSFIQKHSSKIILVLFIALIASNLPIGSGAGTTVTPESSVVVSSSTHTASAVVFPMSTETVLPSSTPTSTEMPTLTATPSPTLTATATATLQVIMPSPTKRKREKTPVAASAPQILQQGPTAACLTVVCTAD